MIKITVMDTPSLGNRSYLASDGRVALAIDPPRDIDLVIGLEKQNILKGLRTLIQIGYRPRIPVTPEQFADSALRDHETKLGSPEARSDES